MNKNDILNPMSKEDGNKNMSQFNSFIRDSQGSAENRLDPETIVCSGLADTVDVRSRTTTRRPADALVAGVPAARALPIIATPDIILGGMVRTGNTSTLTTDTAVSIIAAMPGGGAVADYFDLSVHSVVGTATVVGGVGVTVAGTATVVAPNAGLFRFIVTTAATLECTRLS